MMRRLDLGSDGYLRPPHGPTTSSNGLEKPWLSHNPKKTWAKLWFGPIGVLAGKQPQRISPNLSTREVSSFKIINLRSFQSSLDSRCSTICTLPYHFLVITYSNDPLIWERRKFPPMEECERFQTSVKTPKHL